MNPDIKTAWLEALRSGDFKQGKSALYNTETDTYCCLGVLCELAAREGIVTKRPSESGDNVRYVGADGRGSMSYLPEWVANWAGIGGSFAHNPMVVDPDNEDETTFLAALNDDKNKTFEEIANVIEASL